MTILEAIAIIANHSFPDQRSADAAKLLIRRASQAAPAPSDGLKFQPLEWLETWGGSDDDIPRWDAPNPFWRTVGFCFAGRLYDGKRIDRHKDAPIDWVNEAKAKAQENYEGRVRRCLSAALTKAK
jgi:hypothetical protein